MELVVRSVGALNLVRGIRENSNSDKESDYNKQQNIRFRLVLFQFN